jgi:site-specific recombinase XerD
MPPTIPATWSDATAAYFEHLAARDASRHTLKCYRADLRLFAAWFAAAYETEPSPDALVESVIREWRRQLGGHKQAPATVNRRLASLGSFAKWAAFRGIVAPVEMPRAVRQETRPPRWLSRREELALMRAVERSADPRGIAVVTTLLNTGLRIEELATLRWGAVELGPRKGAVTVVGKGRKQRRVDLNALARKPLRAIRPADASGPVFVGQRGPMTVEGIAGILEAYGKAAALDDFSAHVLRHTFCRRLAEKGVRLEVIAALAGHESLETTRRYVEPGRDDLRAAVDLLAGGDE